MKRCFIFVWAIFSATLITETTAASGSVELDEYSFHKVIKKFEASLVKFDVAFPYGDKHDAFVALAKDSKDVEDLLVAEVGVKDYGEKDNEELAKKYGATKDNFPIVKLFVKGKNEPILFDDSKGFSADELRRFVREKTGLYLSLPGCVKELDKLAAKFINADQDKKKEILKETKAALEKIPEKDSVAGKIYKLIMEKSLEKGDEFTKLENERVKKLLNGKLSEEKKKELGIRLNILQSFQLVDKQKSHLKDDL
ncbi:PREDICTED: endoplasmic reticulum resident protein 29 [Papilio polytes]|uniref:endoplasmic reticulum resident protein 29 n=1 Tax=Papilio polytes TaxID=76194 RepID=UPI0006765A51|nr:PREDICTED: endoplasmic reticulum resident protein 29 [Papilio polytes]